MSCTWYWLSAVNDGNTYMLPLHVSWACLQSGDSQGDISRKGSSWAQHLLCCCSVAQSCPLFATSWTAAHQASLSFTITQSLLKLMSIESVMLSDHLILCRPLLLLPSIFPSIRDSPVSQLFASGGQRIGAWASASVLPMNIQGWFPVGLAGLISFLYPLCSSSSEVIQRHFHSPLVEAAVTDATQIQGERVKTPPVIEEGGSFVGAHGARNIIAICRKSFTNITDLKRWMNKWINECSWVQIHSSQQRWGDWNRDSRRVGARRPVV